MKLTELKRALAQAETAARAVGVSLRKNLRLAKQITEEQQHDIKLELDVRSQALIEKTLHRAFPDIPLLGEEGNSGDTEAEARWVVDPIDGTVNFTYGIPHACVSIALQQRLADGARPSRSAGNGQGDYATLLGVVYDPFCDEIWTALQGKPARLNGRPIRVSKRSRLREALVSIGFSKKRENIDRMMPMLEALLHRVRKIRINGSAALSLVYVATGRFDAYIEPGVRLWDIAAGGLILECAGGEFWHRPLAEAHAFELLANNGLLRRHLQKLG